MTKNFHSCDKCAEKCTGHRFICERCGISLSEHMEQECAKHREIQS